MLGLDRRGRAKAAALAALAGYVDAVGFIGSGGFFLSFMSGNSTRLAVGTAERAAWVLLPLALILAFVVGVMLAEGRRRILLQVALLLAAGALLAPHVRWLALLLVAMAMGAENLVFASGKDVSFGLTYMTGTLVKLGQRLRRGEWAQSAPLLLHWLCLMAGALLGALLWPHLRFDALWLAVAVALLLSMV